MEVNNRGVTDRAQEGVLLRTYPVMGLASKLPHTSSQSHDALCPCQMSFEGPGSVVLDVVSLFPTENVKEAAERGEVNPWPFRADLLGALKALKPA